MQRALSSCSSGTSRPTHASGAVCLSGVRDNTHTCSAKQRALSSWLRVGCTQQARRTPLLQHMASSCCTSGLAVTTPGVYVVCPQVANMGNFPDFEDQYEMFEALRVMHVTITMEGVSKSPAYTQMLLTALGLPLLRRLKVVGGVDEAFGDPVPAAAAAGAGEGLDASEEDEDEHDTGSSSDEE